MSKKSCLFVLGASDPEMVAIETLLRWAGEHVVYACDESRGRVHPGNAYKAYGVLDGDRFVAIPTDEEVVLVECRFRPEHPLQPGTVPVYADPQAGGPVYFCSSGLEEWQYDQTVVVCDHHRPGDPGFGRPPEEFLAASSLGQVLALLGQEPTREQRLMAAADHCLEPAYRGRCPGVDPDEMMRWRVQTRAAFQKRTPEEVLVDVEAARKRLRDAKVAPFRVVVDLLSESDRIHYEQLAEANCDEFHGGYAVVADLRGQDVPELPEAAAREGIPFLATVKDKDGREKVVLQAAGPELIRRFLSGEVIPGLKDIYGDPARGFAGGYTS